MGLQSDHSVDDMRARFLQAPRPLDVGRFVEARPQFDQRSHLFAIARRIDQRPDDRGIAARPVERDLDRQHVRIVAALSTNSTTGS